MTEYVKQAVLQECLKIEKWLCFPCPCSFFFEMRIKNLYILTFYIMKCYRETYLAYFTLIIFSPDGGSKGFDSKACDEERSYVIYILFIHSLLFLLVTEKQFYIIFCMKETLVTFSFRGSSQRCRCWI